MKIKYGYVAVGAGLSAMLGGLLLKDSCEKCGAALFGFGLAHVGLGTLSLLKHEHCIPDTISLPMGKVEIDMQ